MKSLSFNKAAAATALTASVASGAISVGYDFESQSTGDRFTGAVVSSITGAVTGPAAGDVAGWSQDKPNRTSFGQVQALAYIASTNFGGGSTNTGHLGTQFANTSDNSSTTLTGEIDVSSLDFPASRVTLNLAILDDTTDQFTGRDAFHVALTGNIGQGLAEINFTPTVGDDESWDISVAVNGGGATTTTATLDSLAGYVFGINFGPLNTEFSYGPSQGTTSPIIFSTVDPVPLFGAQIANIEMTHEPLVAAGTSANTLVFDDIVVTVPEPGSSLMLCLGLGALAQRRRRA